MNFKPLFNILSGLALAASLSHCGPKETPASKEPSVSTTEAAESQAPPPPPTPVPPPAPAPPPPAPVVLAETTPAEKESIKQFQEELLAARTTMESIMRDAKAASAENPLAAIVPMKTLCQKIQEIKGDGLPAELKSAWGDMSNSFAKTAELFKDFPAKPAELKDWMTKNVGSDAASIKKWQTDFMTKLAAIQAEGDVAKKRFNSIAPKYGIDPKILK